MYAVNDIVGFVEHSTPVMGVIERTKSAIAQVYTKYGFQPFDTRLVEDVQVLHKKGIDSKELFSLNYLSKGTEYAPREERRAMALRFDLTVPLARYIGQQPKNIKFPFLRYHIAKVYRAEHAKVLTGRYNEFYQSDIDVIGQGSVDLAYDSLFPAIICEIFQEIFHVQRFVIRISNRKLLEGLFMNYGIPAASIRKCIKIIDDIEKVPEVETVARLNEVGMSLDNAVAMLALFTQIWSMKPTDAIAHLRTMEWNALAKEGIDELEVVFAGIADHEHVKLDPRIARGLDYYTGTVYETMLLDHPELGSVCSGGRYDDLVGSLAGNTNVKYPGVGVSIGLSRLVPTLIEKGYLSVTNESNSVMIACTDPADIPRYNAIAKTLRDQGLEVEVFLQRDKKLRYQLSYADKKGYKYLIVCGPNDVVNLRNMRTKLTECLTETDLVTHLI